MPRTLSLVLPLLLTGCAAPAASAVRASLPPHASPSALVPPQEPIPGPSRARPRWPVGPPMMHGFLGASLFEHVEVDGSGPGRIDGDQGDMDQFPVIGGGAQWKFGGERVDLGLEGLMSFSWQGDVEAIAIGGGAAVAVDVDLLLFELFGGPFASLFLGEKLRLYGAAGPLMQFADYSQSGSGLGDDGSGFGVGWYARTGLEFALPSRTWLGLGVRWSDSTVDLGSDLGDLELEGVQAVLTVSRGI